MDDWLKEAHELGRDAARTAATWTMPNNADEHHALRVLAMLEDGDPVVDDYLPAYPTLSGGDPTPLSLARDITGLEDVDPDTIDAIAEAWQGGVSDEFYAACESELRRYLET